MMARMFNRVRQNARWIRVGFFTLTVVGPAVQRFVNRGRQRRREVQEQIRKQAMALSQRTGERVAELADAAQQAAGAVTTTATRLAERAPVKPVSIARSRRGGTFWWIAGLGVGLVAAGTTAYIVVRRRFAPEEVTESVELPPAGLNGQIPQTTSQTHEATPAPASAPAEPAPAASPTEGPTAEAPFIGNVRTGIYHRATSPDLPAEDHRMYFKTQEEAEAMGFRPDPDEFASEDRV